jgi:O-antigen ligase
MLRMQKNGIFPLPEAGLSRTLSARTPSALPQLRIDRFGQFQRGAALLVFLLCLVGYQLTSMIVTFLRIDSQSLTILYRAAVAGFSLIIIMSGLFGKLKGRLDFWLCLFFLLYLGRLIFDRAYNTIPGNDQALLFFIATIMLPVGAVSLAGIDRFSDVELGRPLLVCGFLTVSLALLAQVLGLAYNAWEIYGTNDVRLEFQSLNAIALGHIAATTVLTGIFMLLNSDSPARWRLFALATIATSSLLLVQASSRGALLSVGGGLLWFLFSRAKRAAVYGPLLVPLALIGLSQTNIFQKTLETVQGGWQNDASSRDRIDAQAVAIADFWDSPIFGMHFFNPLLEAGEYPHNMVIETAMALGVVGLSVLALIFMRLMFKLFRGYNSSHSLIAMLLAQYAIGSLLSGAIWGSSSLFMLMMMALASPASVAAAREMNSRVR